MNIEQIKILLNDLLAQENLSLYELKWEKEGKDDYLRVFVDKDDGHVSLDDIVLVSEKISQALDKIVTIKDGYILDVSSSGAEKEIPRAKIANKINSYIKVALTKPYKTYESLEGTLLDVDDEKIILQVNFKGRISKVQLELENIRKINYAIKF